MPVCKGGSPAGEPPFYMKICEMIAKYVFRWGKMGYNTGEHSGWLTPGGDVRRRLRGANILLIDREGRVRCGRWEGRSAMQYITGAEQRRTA